MIKFEKMADEAKLLSVMTNFKPEIQRIEYRVDPLTKETTFINVTAMEIGVKWSLASNEEELQEIIEKSREGCFMCSGQVEKVTPKFPEEILPEGRLRVGKAYLFPNALALSRYAAVLTFPEHHFLGLNEYTPDVLIDCLGCAKEFIMRVHAVDPEAQHAAIGCNYLFPAGSSTVHSHFHIFVDPHPFDYVNKLMMDSQRYFKENAVNYWSELIDTEMELGERYVGRIGNTDWLIPFAPMGGKEVQALVRGKSNFGEWDTGDIESLAQGLSRILQYYQSQKVSSFNLLVYSGPLGTNLEYFWSGIRIVTRGYLPPYYTSDITWRQKQMLRREEWFDMPETLAAQLREVFQK